ncbi:DinB family protein [Roseibium algae]|uniref:DinB family protein n=1 Tax=Roseibium algae TaxID=3123038 RepID=A0ABU8THV3_9HYPH
MSAALEQLCLMARNNAWANGRLLGACLALSQAEFEAERSGFFPSIRETLNHNLSVDRYYLDSLVEGGKGRAVYDEEPAKTVAALLREQADQDRALIVFCEALIEDDLSRELMQDRGEHGMFSERIDRTLLHLFQHQTHHRGQAHAMLSSTQVAPPQLDEFFLEFDRHPTAIKLF